MPNAGAERDARPRCIRCKLAVTAAQRDDRPVAMTGLRERKKSETRRAIATVALRLVTERGPDAVTVEDIAAAANVSVRTVFNHFGTKDEAILGIDPERRAELAATLVARPASERPVAALAATFLEVLTSADDTSNLWLARARLVREHPQLRAAQVASQAALEEELADAVAARTRLDPVRDLYPRLVVAVSLAAVRRVLDRPESARPQRLRREIEAAFEQLAGGLVPPEPGP